ncbi:hypothetical protein [Ferruginibacter sp.]
MKKLSTLIASLFLFIAVNAQTYAGTVAPNTLKPGDAVAVSFALTTGAPMAGLSIYVDDINGTHVLTTNTIFGGQAYKANYTVPANQPVPSIVNFAVGNGTTFYGVVSSASVLPVVFVSSDVKFSAAENKATISWKIAQNDGVKEFDILRSSDGRNYTKVGTVAPGTSLTYSYDDQLATAVDGVYYYKISGVSMDGAVKETASMAVKKGNKNTRPVILGNSNVKNVITLSGINLMEYKTGEIKVLDAMGRSCAATVQSSNTIAVNNLTAGVYYLKIKDLPALNFIAQ